MNNTQVNSDETIDKIISQISQFQEGIDKLREEISPKWKTSGFLDSNEVIIPTSCKKIHVASKKDVVVILNALMTLKKSYADSFEFLGQEPDEEVQIISNYSIDDFMFDLKKRYQMIVLKEKEAALQKMRSIAESFESDNRKRDKALSNILTDLGKFSLK